MSTAVTLANGAQITSDMSPLERHNAVAKAMNLPTVARPTGVPFGPPGPYTVAPDAAPGTVGNKPAPPTPKQLEAANKPLGDPSPDRMSEFEKEMQEKGLMRRPDGKFIAEGQIDADAIADVNAIFAALPPDKRAAMRADYEEALRDIYAGYSPSRDESEADGESTPPAIPAQTDDWQQHVEDGQWVGLENLTLAHTGGYTLERFVKDQRLNVAAIQMLRDARAAGLSQKQVNAYFRQGAIRAGWVKA